MTYARARAVLVLVAVFALGGVCGAALMHARDVRSFDRLVGPDGARRGAWRMRVLARHLDLTREQREKVRTILDGHAAERDTAMRQAMDQCGGPLLKLKAKVDGEIRAVLSPDQQEKFDALAARQADRLFFPSGGHGRGRGGRRGGPPSGSPPAGGPPPF